MINEFEIKLDNYQGPIEKLLLLIEEKKLEINQISLAQVTNDFLNYIKELEENKVSTNLIADFLFIASKLILIKTKQLLPFLKLDKNEEEDIAIFQWRLKFYQKLKIVEKEFKNLWSDEVLIFTREYLTNFQSLFYPANNFNILELEKTIQKISNNLEIYFKPIIPIENKIVSLKEKIEMILNRITTQTNDVENFSSLLQEKTKSELVVLFLALLHLIKDQLILVEQKENFGEILIKKNK